jgi:hypothetical protein
VTVAADHMGHVQRSAFIKARIERAIHTTRIGLQTILDCSLLSFQHRFLPEFPCRVVQEYRLAMTYSRDSTVYSFDPNKSSLLHGMVQSRTGVRQGDPFGPLLFNLAIITPLQNIRERCKYSAAIQAFYDDGKYLIKTPFVPTVITVANEELGKICSKVRPIKSSCMAPPHTAPELVEVIRAMVPVVTGTSNLGAPLAMDFSMVDGSPASHNENYVHSWLQDIVEAHQLLLDKIDCFAMSDFGGTHATFCSMITCAVRHYGFLLRTLPPRYLPTVPCYCM